MNFIRLTCQLKIHEQVAAATSPLYALELPGDALALKFIRDHPARLSRVVFTSLQNSDVQNVQ